MSRPIFKANLYKPNVILSIGILLLGIRFSSQVSFLEDVTLTLDQKLKLNEFKTLVGSSLPHDYMREDIYLVRWLRARKYNLQAARTMLMQNIKWREDNDIDNILNEDWSDFEREYRYAIEGCDIEGRPVTSLYVGDWDIRKVVVAGHSQKMMRYFDKFFEEMAIFIRRAQDQGQNVSQYSELYDMSQYNIRQQGCALCVPIYLYLFQSYENHYPGSAHKTVLVNTPAVFQALWQILSPLMSEDSRSSIFIFGKDKSEWQPLLFKEIDRSQLTWELGGVKEFPIDMEAIRRQPNGTFQCTK